MLSLCLAALDPGIYLLQTRPTPLQFPNPHPTPPHPTLKLDGRVRRQQSVQQPAVRQVPQRQRGHYHQAQQRKHACCNQEHQHQGPGNVVAAAQGSGRCACQPSHAPAGHAGCPLRPSMALPPPTHAYARMARLLPAPRLPPPAPAPLLPPRVCASALITMCISTSCMDLGAAGVGSGRCQLRKAGQTGFCDV